MGFRYHSIYQPETPISGSRLAQGPISVGGWSGGAMVLGKLPVPGRPTILIQ